MKNLKTDKQKPIKITDSYGWSLALVFKYFDIKRVFDCEILNDWLAAKGSFSTFDDFIMEDRRKALIENVGFWSEEDLKMKFISHIIELAHFEDEAPIRSYYDRTISAVVNNIKITVKSDLLIAKGVGDILETPYFCIQEYKKRKGSSGDGEGQMLAGMLVAQAQNSYHKPIYGCYILGANWYFCVLNGRQYCESEPYSATSMTDLKQIVLILRKLKTIIREKLLV
jgi:hypothetical protein